MNEVMGRAMEELVRDVGDRTAGPPDDLWRRGARRRQRSRAAAAAVFTVVAALVAFAAWPAVSPGPTVPATPAPAVTQPRTYPSVLSHPYFAPDVSSAHRAMTAVVMPGSTAYAIDAKGDAWKVKLPKFATYAALSPDGRWMVDGKFVHDLVTGSSAPVAHPAPPDDQDLWATWSPTSSLYARTYGLAGRIVVATPAGEELSVPGMVDHVRVGLETPAAAGWLDAQTLLVAWSVPETTKLTTFTWRVGAPAWSIGPTLTFPGELQADLTGTGASVSADGRTLAMPATDPQVGRYTTSLVTFDLSEAMTDAGPVAGSAVDLRTTSAIDGMTWRGGDLFVTVGGRTGVPGETPIVDSGSGFAGPTSWRADALVGEPYVNTEAIWRARLVNILGIALGLLGVWLLWRGGLWGARRLGIIDGPLPLRADLGWWRKV